MLNTTHTCAHNIIYKLEKLNKGLLSYLLPTLYNVAKVR